MNFSYNLIQKFVDKDLPEAHKLAELLTMHSFEVEEVKKAGDDYILDIDILPNRAHDAASHIGVAREAAALTGAKLKFGGLTAAGGQTSLSTKPSKTKDIEVEIKSEAACPRYMAAVINGVEVKESPAWLKDVLESLGLNSINNIVDAANYAMLATGQPLHIFDLDKIKDKKIIVRHAKKGETIKALDGEGYILDESMPVIADSEAALAIAGIKGGARAEVGEGTKDIVIEAANFEPSAIRSTSQKLGLRTDASWRFEHDTPASLVPAGLDMVAEVIQELAGGKLKKEAVDTLKEPLQKKTAGIRPGYAQKLLGINLTEEKISSILESLEFEVHKEDDMLHAKIPLFRLDIEREEDLVEEVGRIVGYENVEHEMPFATLNPPRRNVKNYWMKQVRRHLSVSGFNEVYNYSFVSDDIFNIWGFSEKDMWELENPASEEFKYMRPSLLPGILNTVRKNLKYYENVMLFEAGEVFHRSKGEEPRLCLAIGEKKGSDNDFYRLKGEVEHLFNALGMSDLWFDDALKKAEEEELAYMHPKRTALVKTGDETLGFMGQLHPQAADSQKLKGAMFVADIDLEMLVEKAEEEEIYSPVSDYPKVVRDMAVIVSKFTKANEVMQEISNTGGKVLRDVDMFDYYEEIDNTDKKSMAFHLIFQAHDRTLKSKEVDELMEKIEKAINNQGWEVR